VVKLSFFVCVFGFVLARLVVFGSVWLWFSALSMLPNVTFHVAKSDFLAGKKGILEEGGSTSLMPSSTSSCIAYFLCVGMFFGNSPSGSILLYLCQPQHPIAEN
jgi:hypothetical protein